MNVKMTFLCFVSGVAGLASAVADDLQTILGSPTNEWRIDRAYSTNGTTNDFRLGKVDGTFALSAGPNAAVLTCSKPITADSEITVRFRLAPSDGKSTTVYFYSGLKNADDPGYNPLFMHFSVLPGAAPDMIHYQLAALPGQTSDDWGYYGVRSLPKDRSTWPEMVRQRAEEEYAELTPLAHRWLTLRYVVRPHAVQVYLDGRLLRDASGIGIEPEGCIRLHVYEGAHLASIRVRQLPPDDPRFETVHIDYYLNAATIGRDRVQAGSLPPADKPTIIQGVPFVFPAVDERGNDHIDLSRSWARFGLLEGGYDGGTGDTARWKGALFVEPGRIQFRIPNGPYSHLHLIAAAEGGADTVPIVTVQFYRPAAGHPVSFRSQVPLFTARSSGGRALPVTLASGRKGHLYLVTIPLEPEGLAAFTDLPYLEMELTKEVQVYRAFPDPMYYSVHQSGLPSSVQVYAMTFEKPSVVVDWEPDRFAHIWTAPEKPWYTVSLRNLTAEKQSAKVHLATASLDGSDRTSRAQTVCLEPNGVDTIKMPLSLKRYGYHKVELKVTDRAGTRTQTRSLAYLHPDTRERGGWEEGKGPVFGFWDWDGAHVTPVGIPRLEAVVRAGVESSGRPLTEGKYPFPYSREELLYAAAHGMSTPFLAYELGMTKEFLGVDWDPTKPAEMQKALVEALRKDPMATPTAVNKPELALFFAEAMLGPVSYLSQPEYFGEPPYQMTAAEWGAYSNYLSQIVIGGTAIKQAWPNARCLVPYGIPTFPIPYLRYSKEATAIMDGPALDLVLFERLPEMQIDQVTFASTMWQLQQEWKKTGKPWPHLITIEGPGVAPSMPGALTMQEEADRFIRGTLILSAYGTTRFLGCPVTFACADSWGEQHYGGGMCERIPLLSPKVFYSAFATMTRQLNRMNFVKAIPTGSLTTFCYQFSHYKTGERLHVFWTIRGSRAVTLSVPAGASVTVFDQMDNDTVLTERNGRVTLTTSTAPCYVRGLKGDAKIALGAPDNSDSKPSRHAVTLGNLGDGSWKISAEPDTDYETSHAEFVRRFPGRMSVDTVKAPSEQGGRALTVRLLKQPKDRVVMPFYTTLVPSKPITIPGKASHLGLWVRAASDWGRVVYLLRDAHGERWISVGKKNEWNVDDIPCASVFCFDGWRYLRFELPGNEPYDCFRDAGSTWWGYYGKGDGIVDLPLTLEKIVVERRTHVIAGTELFPANTEDVLLAGLYAEYAKSADRTDEAIRLSRLRMTPGSGARGGAGGKPQDYNPFQ